MRACCSANVAVDADGAPAVEDDCCAAMEAWSVFAAREASARMISRTDGEDFFRVGRSSDAPSPSGAGAARARGSGVSMTRCEDCSG